MDTTTLPPEPIQQPLLQSVVNPRRDFINIYKKELIAIGVLIVILIIIIMYILYIRYKTPPAAALQQKKPQQQVVAPVIPPPPAPQQQKKPAAALPPVPAAAQQQKKPPPSQQQKKPLPAPAPRYSIKNIPVVNNLPNISTKIPTGFSNQFRT